MNWTGIPYLDGGRTRAGCDCWGLVRLVMAEECGVALDDHADVGADEVMRVARRIGKAIETDTWRRVERPERHDVAVMSHVHRRVAFHCGIMVDRRRVLHVWESTDSVIMPTSHPWFTNRIIGFFRHRELERAAA